MRQNRVKNATKRVIDQLTCKMIKATLYLVLFATVVIVGPGVSTPIDNQAALSPDQKEFAMKPRALEDFEDFTEFTDFSYEGPNTIREKRGAQSFLRSWRDNQYVPVKTSEASFSASKINRNPPRTLPTTRTKGTPIDNTIITKWKDVSTKIKIIAALKKMKNQYVPAKTSKAPFSASEINRNPPRTLPTTRTKGTPIDNTIINKWTDVSTKMKIIAALKKMKKSPDTEETVPKIEKEKSTWDKAKSVVANGGKMVLESFSTGAGSSLAYAAGSAIWPNAAHGPGVTSNSNNRIATSNQSTNNQQTADATITGKQIEDIVDARMQGLYEGLTNEGNKSTIVSPKTGASNLQ